MSSEDKPIAEVNEPLLESSLKKTHGNFPFVDSKRISTTSSLIPKLQEPLKNRIKSKYLYSTTYILF